MRRIWYHFSKGINPVPKREGVVRKEEPTTEMLEKERYQKNFQLLNSSKFDPLSLIRIRFIDKKKQLADRRVYIFDKKELMLELDAAYKQIQKKHQNYFQSLRPRPGPGQIAEKIRWEIRMARIQYFENLIADDYFMCGVYIVFLVIIIWYDHSARDDYNIKLGTVI